MKTVFTQLNRLTAILLIIIVCFCNTAFGSSNSELMPNNSGVFPQQATQQKKAIWDVLFNYSITDSLPTGWDATVDNGWAGVHYAFNEFWVSQWFTDTIVTLNTDGSFKQMYEIPGLTFVRALTADSNYMYAASAGSQIFRIDPVTKAPAPPHINIGSLVARHCSFDQTLDGGNGGFWVGNWNTDITAVDMSGAVLSSIPAATHGLTGMYGSAIDNFSPNGPFLWIFDQTIGAALVQVDLATGSILNFHDANSDVGAVLGPGGAGGAFMSTTVVPGKVVLGGVMQNDPSLLFGYEYDAAQLPCVQIANFLVTDPNCNGGSDGTIGLTGLGGMAPLTYTWDNGASGNMITGLAAGSYTVSISDANNCPDQIATFSVLEPDAIVSGLSQTQETCTGCADGTATVSPMGGTPPYTFAWNTVPVQNTQVANGLSAGMYSCIITDANGCTTTIDANIGVMSSIADLSSDLRFQIFETANSNVFQIVANLESAENVTATVFDITGKMVTHKSLGYERSFKTEITLNGLNAGIYLVQLTSSASQGVQKIIIH